MLTKYQNENREILRSQIQLADYNPRKITQEALKKLKKNIKVRGLMGGLAWNQTTSNLIAGHQRLTIIDQLMKYDGSPESDYKVRVDVAHLSEKDEKEQNIFMNSKAVQGEFNYDLLKDLVADIDINMAGLGEYDLKMLDMNEDPETNEPIEKSKRTSDQFDEPGLLGIEDSEDAFISIHFDDFLSKAEFMEKLGVEIHTTAISGEDFKELIQNLINSADNRFS